MIPYLLAIAGGYLIGKSFDNKFEGGGIVSDLDYNNPNWYNKSYDEKVKIEKERLALSGIEIGDLVSKIEDHKLLTGVVKIHPNKDGMISPIMVEFDKMTQKAIGSKRDKINGYKLYLKKFVSGGKIEYDVEIVAKGKEDGNKYRFMYDIVASNEEDAKAKAEYKFSGDQFGDLDILETKIVHEYEYEMMADGGSVSKPFIENPVFTYQTEIAHDRDRSSGYISDYDIVRVVMDYGDRKVDFPVYSLEEYNEIKNNENKAKYVIESYPSKHYYDAQEFYDPEDDRDYVYEDE